MQDGAQRGASGAAGELATRGLAAAAPRGAIAQHGGYAPNGAQGQGPAPRVLIGALGQEIGTGLWAGTPINPLFRGAGCAPERWGTASSPTPVLPHAQGPGLLARATITRSGSIFAHVLAHFWRSRRQSRERCLLRKRRGRLRSLRFGSSCAASRNLRGTRRCPSGLTCAAALQCMVRIALRGSPGPRMRAARLTLLHPLSSAHRKAGGPGRASTHDARRDCVCGVACTGDAARRGGASASCSGSVRDAGSCRIRRSAPACLCASAYVSACTRACASACVCTRACRGEGG